MKIHKIIFLIFLFTVANSAIQDDPIQKLYSEDDSEVLQALGDIQLMKLMEAIPVIHELLESKYFIPYIHLEMIITLHLLGDEDFPFYADMIIENSSTFDQAPIPLDPAQAQAVIYILWYLHEEDHEGYFDMSYQYFIENYNDPYFPFFLEALKKALNSLYEQFSKNTLINVVQSHDKYVFRIGALINLYSKYGSDIYYVAENTFLNDVNPNNRLMALTLLSNSVSAGTRNFIIENILNENESTIRYQGARYILEKFGEPIDLSVVVNLKNIESDELYLSLYSFDINNFIPPPFDESLTSLQAAEIIKDHIRYLESYRWCPEQYYMDHINEVEGKLINNEYQAALDYITEIIIPKIEDEYQNNIITTEGYKFLYYEFQYLYERILSEM
jgi:hypothetical protein